MPFVLLGLFALLAPATAVGFHFLLKTKFNNLNYWIKQLIIGLVFGGIAVLCTEFGVKNEGAVMNVRDSAPIIAGLVFGWPAGLISGFIGGLERFFSAFWRGTYYTQLACSVSTFISGALASLAYFCFYRQKRVSWYQGALMGAVCETSHILMIFITNMSEPITAFRYVSKIGNPMIIAVSLSVALGAGIINILTYKKIKRVATHHNWEISHILQLSLFISVLVAYFAMAAFTYRIQTTIATSNAKNTLTNDVQDTTKDVQDRSDEHLLSITNSVADHLEAKNAASETIDSDYLVSLIDQTVFDGVHFDVSEINIVDKNGIIIYSSNSDWINFDMNNNGEQPKEFCDAILVNHKSEYVQGFGVVGGDENIKMKYAAKMLSFSGFVQVGYDDEHFYNQLHSIIDKTIRNRHVGENGFIIVTDLNGNVVGATEVDDSSKTPTDFTFDGDLNTLESQKVYQGTVKIDNQTQRVHFLFEQKEGFYITAFMLDSEIQLVRNMAIYIATYQQFIIFGLIYGIVYGIFSHFVFHDLKNVNKGLKDISEGNLNVVLNSHYSKEFGELNYSINETVHTLKTINEKEMENAKAIQMGALPPKEAFFDTHHFDIYAEMKTAKEVGGDFYDYFPIGKDKMAILIADVSGKGIPAALFMMRTKSLIKSLLETGMSIDETIKHTNLQLCQNNDAKMFVTCWIGIVDLTNGNVEFVNAGHNPPLIKQNGKYSYLRAPANLVLGALKKAKYQKQLLVLKPGDVIFLYTDGITEAKAENDDMYQEERLINYLNSVETIDPKKITNGVLEDTLAFVNGFEQSDDMTMLTFSYYGYSKRYSYEYDGVIEAFKEAKEELSKDLTNENIPNDVIMKTIVCYDEIFSNCAKYAYANKKGKINVTLDISEEQIALTISDNGEPFNPLEKNDADTTSSLENRKIGGLGIHMVKNFMYQYHYYYQDSKNVLILQKYRHSKNKGEQLWN